MAIPTIAIGTPSRTKISSVSGYDQATVTFQSDVALQSWEARATTEGQTPGHGVGLLVESGGSLEANTDATVYVDDEELTNGDLEYTITVFGHGTNGYWSDGSYEGINIIDWNTDIVEVSSAVVTNGTIVFDTGNENTDESGAAIKIQTWKENWSAYDNQHYYSNSTGDKVVQITKTSAFDWIRICTNGDVSDASVMIDVSDMETDSIYNILFNVESVSANHAVVKNISIVKVVV